MRQLNDMQRLAVAANEGQYLVLAGAGSGKTTVLAERVARLIREGRARPDQILAITFTNKAATEMKERIAAQFAGTDLRDMWCCTFHSMCVRILRLFPQAAGFPHSFTIYDADDTKKIVHDILDETEIAGQFDDGMVKGWISAYKNSRDVMLEQDRISENAEHTGPMSLSEYEDSMDAYTFGRWCQEHTERPGDVHDMNRLYNRYMDRLRREDAMDFDDLLLNGRLVATRDDRARACLQKRFRYVLIDEYQDTNPVQYEIVRNIVALHKNLFVVGDDDQSIYGFRGTDISIIRGFEGYYSDAQVIRLEQNYRSVSGILDAANTVIAVNTDRLGKTLWTDNGSGVKPTLYIADDEYEEAKAIAADVLDRHEKHGDAFSSCAVLYRLRRISKSIEDEFVRRGIPYRVVGGVSFYSRKEIKDVMAYLTLIAKSSADQYLMRILNVPRRGIGQATLRKICKEARLQQRTLLDMMRLARTFLTGATVRKMEDFAAIIDGLAQFAKDRPVQDVLEAVLEKTGYLAMLQNDEKHGEERVANVGLLVSAAAQFDRDEGGSLLDFVQQVALMTDQDIATDMEDAVQLMTVHTAKGLEFDNVYVAGMGEGLFPSFRAIDQGETEEERRLCYVAMTRAKKRLMMLCGMERTEFGKKRRYKPSRFFDEVGEDNAVVEAPAQKRRAASSEARRSAASRFVPDDAEKDEWEAEGQSEYNEPFTIRGGGPDAYRIILDRKLSDRSGPRFVVVAAEGGRILDNANGYGYKSPDNAYRAWAYKVRNRKPASAGRFG